MTALFKKDKKEEKKKEVKETSQIEVAKEEKIIEGNWSASDGSLLKGFYVSEKASLLNSFNQYVFKVDTHANKAEVKKQVEKVFSVKVRDVKILIMPEKRRDMGRHPGVKPGFKKAVVRLQEGHSIDQAKA